MTSKKTVTKREQIIEDFSFNVEKKLREKPVHECQIIINIQGQGGNCPIPNAHKHWPIKLGSNYIFSAYDWSIVCLMNLARKPFGQF